LGNLGFSPVGLGVLRCEVLGVTLAGVLQDSIDLLFIDVLHACLLDTVVELVHLVVRLRLSVAHQMPAMTTAEAELLIIHTLLLVGAPGHSIVDIVLGGWFDFLRQRLNKLAHLLSSMIDLVGVRFPLEELKLVSIYELECLLLHPLLEWLDFLRVLILTAPLLFLAWLLIRCLSTSPSSTLLY